MKEKIVKKTTRCSLNITFLQKPLIKSNSNKNKNAMFRKKKRKKKISPEYGP